MEPPPEAHAEAEPDGCGQELAGAGADDIDPGAGEAVPEMLDLIDEVAEAAGDVEGLSAVVANIGRRIRASPADRDLLSDFEGIAQLCTALSGPPHEWGGEAMLQLCRAMPDVCRTSAVNRGALREGGFVGAAVELLRGAVAAGDGAGMLAACTALAAACTASDGNKKAAAQLRAAEPPAGGGEGPGPEALSKPGALVLLLDALARFPESIEIQAEAAAALHSLLVDDDPRKAECEPSAAENREVATSDDGFPHFAAAVDRALALADAADAPEQRPPVRLRIQALLLLRELSRRQDRVQALALGAKLLPRVQGYVGSPEGRVVRASLAVLRNFAMDEEVRDELALITDGARRCLSAVGKHLETPGVCEQGFGLFSNLTLRRSPIAGRLNEGAQGIVALATWVLRRHRDRHDVTRVVISTMRNTAANDELACKEIKESDIFEEVRQLVRLHEHDSKWRACMDISRQFLREWRMDQGLEKAAKYNAYY